ncbi:helix-turn-helix domain-containing protein [Pseudomonas chlororaphis]|uniref:helix-turn-helix domain-containing protein n=1 Tax=Pseudomonas chlororaphis TaxID=587753 RepID=UPI0024080B2E|nr:helix-turn-helix transcriptional regulator [Pseudomonas chlororaphis]
MTKRANSTSENPAPGATRKTPGAIPEERKVFAANFRKARIAANLSQRDIHDRTGIAQSYLSEVERCLCNPSLDTLAALAAVVGKPLHLLLKP